MDFVQLLRFIALTLLTAPPNYQWQQLLERAFPAYTVDRPEQRKDVELNDLESGQNGRGSAGSTNSNRKFSLRNTITKWFIDCMTVGALMNTLAFFVIMGILKGQSGSLIWGNIQRVSSAKTHSTANPFILTQPQETIPIILASYKIWPLASIVSFSLIPVHRRIVFLSFVGLLWGVYMSLVAARV